MDGFILTPGTFAKLSRKINETTGAALGQASGGGIRQTCFVRVTGAAVSGWYPAVVTDPKADGTWADRGTCEVKDENGAALASGTRYQSQRTGNNSGTPRFITKATATPPPGKVKGKLDAALSYGGSATLSVWAWSGSAEADTGTNVTVYDWLLKTGQSIPSGTQVTAFYDADTGRYYLDGAQC